MITTMTGRSRPKATAFNAAALETLANTIREHALKVDAVAKALREKSEGRAVKVNYYVSVSDGLEAIRSFCRDAEGKIDRNQFVDITTETPPATANPPERITRLPRKRS